MALTELCLRSKAAHGYDAAFMSACRSELTVRLDEPGHRFVVAEEAGAVVGLAEISVDGTTAELEKLFVDPFRFGRGIGRELFRWACREAGMLGAERITIVSDPGAKAFYVAMGAIEAGVSPSGSIPGRFLPRLRLELAKSGVQ